MLGLHTKGSDSRAHILNHYAISQHSVGHRAAVIRQLLVFLISTQFVNTDRSNSRLASQCSPEAG